jgi:hypothetical protein
MWGSDTCPVLAGRPARLSRGKGRRPSLSHSPTRRNGWGSRPYSHVEALEALRMVTDKLNDDLSPAENAARLLEGMLEYGNDAEECDFHLQTLSPMQRATLMYAARVLRSDVHLSAIPQGLQPTSLKGTTNMQATVVTSSGRRRSSIVDNVFARHPAEDSESATSVVNDWLRREYTPLGATFVTSGDRIQGPSSSLLTATHAPDTADAPSGAPAENLAEGSAFGHGQRGNVDEEHTTGAASAALPEGGTHSLSLKPSSLLVYPCSDEPSTMPGLPTINLNNMSADDVTCYEATASEKADISEALQGVDQWNWSVLALHEASAQHGLQVLESRGSLSLGLPPPSLLVHPPLSHTLQLLSLRSQQAVPEFMTEHVCTTRCWGGIFLKPGACLMS